MNYTEMMYQKYGGNKLLFLDGSQIACQAINRAKSWGIKTVVANYYRYEDNPGKQIADEYYDVDFSDVELMVDLIRKNHIDGVMAGWTDSHLEKYARICKAANVPCYSTEELFYLFTHKKEYKELLTHYDIPVIKDYRIHNDEDLDQLGDSDFPLIVKPSDGSGSRGIRVCTNKKELVDGISYAKSFSSCGDVIIEKFITGDEIVAFWYIQDGHAFLTACGNWHKMRVYENVNDMGVGYTFPSVYLGNYEKTIAPKMIRMFKETGVKNGLFFTQSFVVNNEILLYDIGYRLTGTLDYIITSNICQYNTMEKMIEFALSGTGGESVKNMVDPHYRGKYGWNVSVLIQPGTITKIVGYGEVKQIDGVIEAVMDHQVGDVITEAEKGNLSQVVLRVLGSSTTKEQMVQQMAEINKKFDVLGENGDSLLISSPQFEKYIRFVE